jgi:hypothetical protein
MLNQDVNELKVDNESLTVQKLRTFKGFENTTEDEAENIILNLSRLSSILYKTFQKHINKTD